MKDIYELSDMPKLFSDLFSDERISEYTAVYDGEVPISYGKIKNGILQCASKLISLGVKPGDHVGIYAYNSINWIIAFFAIVRIGSVAVLLNSKMAPEFIAPMLRQTDVRFLVCDNCHGMNNEGKENVIRRLGYADRFLDLHEVDFCRQTGREIQLPPENKNEKKTDVIIFTSGTTALPKAVMLSQGALLSNIYRNMKLVPDLTEKSWYIALPFFHSFGLAILLTSFISHIPASFSAGMVPADIIATIERNQINGIAASVGYGIKILQNENFGKKASEFLHLCLLGGERADENALRAIEKIEHRYPDISVVIGYGQTEAGPVISISSANDSRSHRLMSVGRPANGTSVRIVDDFGNEVQCGVAGEIVVTSDSVMNGYYKESKDDQPFDEKGWLYTGDIGFLDTDGYLHICGRSRDIIIVNGENISVAEIESTISKIPQIRDVCVFGMPDPKSGEKIVCCVTMDPQGRFDEKELKEQAEKLLPSIKIPNSFICFESFPYNKDGTVDKSAIKRNVTNG